MKGSAFAERLPENPGPERERMILDAVRRRDIAPVVWRHLWIAHQGPSGKKYLVKLYVSEDTLRIGDRTDSFRATVNHRTAQHIADELGATLPTPKIADEIYKQSVVVIPAPTRGWFADGSMSKTSRMLEQSRLVDEALAKEIRRIGGTGLMANQGKDWVTTSKLWTNLPRCEDGPPCSANYGFYSPSGTARSPNDPSLTMYQSVGTRHGMNHTDYSQTVRLVRLDALVYGPGMGRGGRPGSRVIDVRRIATDPELAGALNHDGALPTARHPSVEPLCSAPCPGDVSSDTPSMTCAEGTVLGWDLKCYRPEDVPDGELLAEGVTFSSSATLPGNLTCEKCSEVGPPSPDPTGGEGSKGEEPPLPFPPPGHEYLPPLDQEAGMGAGVKLLVFGVGMAAGYFATTRLLPTLQES